MYNDYKSNNVIKHAIENVYCNKIIKMKKITKIIKQQDIMSVMNLLKTISQM